MLPPPNVPHRWLWLALPDDCRQEQAIIDWLYAAFPQRTRRTMLSYRLRQLRHEVWDREPTRGPKAPPALRPSKLARITGYRQDSTRHSQARMTIDPERRRAIARKGASCRTAESFSNR
jgi:hypothetical protein